MKNALGSEIRNKHMLDTKRLVSIAREREEELRKTVTLKFGIVKNTVDLEELYRKDCISNKGFKIDTSVRYENQGMDTSIIDMDSVLSYLYGVKESDPVSIKEKRYTCNCKTDNIRRAGEWCPKCRSYAIEHIKDRGWFILNNGLKVFNPYMLSLLVSNKKSNKKLPTPSSYVEDKVRPDQYPWLTNIDFEYNIYTLQDKTVLRQFIIDYIRDDCIDFFLESIDALMTSKIPVMSKNLRHYHVVMRLDGTPDVKTHELNNHYFLINNKVDMLNNEGASWSKGKIIKYLSDINKEFAAIHSIVVGILGDGKESEYRGKVAGNRKGSSAKLIIEGSMDYVTHACELSYTSFGVMYLEWHYDLFKKHGLTAESEIRIRTMRPSTDDYVMLTSVLLELQKMDLAWVAGYRPPTLFRCSWQSMFITGLNSDGAIRVTEINLGYNFGGDHDGDQMIIFALDPKIRLQMAFAFHGRMTVYDPIRGLVNSPFELQESIYFSAYRLFKHDVKLEDILVDHSIKGKSFKISDNYGEQYDQEAVSKFVKKLNSDNLL